MSIFIKDIPHKTKIKNWLESLEAELYYLRYIASRSNKKYYDVSSEDRVSYEEVKKKRKVDIYPLLYNGVEIGTLLVKNTKKLDEDKLSSLILYLYSNIMSIDFLMIETKLNDKSKNMFVANVSHEIRTPLNSIIGMLSILQDTTLTDAQTEYTNIIRDSSYNLMNLINDLLDISKLESGLMQLKFTPFNLYELVKTSSKIALSEKQHSVKFKRKIHSKVPLKVIGDEQRLKQIIINLTSNSFKYTSKGSVLVDVNVVSEKKLAKYGLRKLDVISTEVQEALHITYEQKLVDDEKKGSWCYVIFSFIDTGIGIKKDDFDKLFKIFSQLDSSTSKTHKGTGLGLSLVQKLVDLHKGVINFTSVYEQGSTFYVIIPFQIYNDINNTIDYEILKNRNVLIVDDNENNVFTLSRLFDQYNVGHVDCTSSRLALLNYINNPLYQFDIALIDICMPVLDGNGLVDKISDDRKFPIIALSSRDERISGISKRFSAHLVKPFKESDLMDLICKLISTPPATPRRSERKSPRKSKLSSSPGKRIVCSTKSQSDVYYCNSSDTGDSIKFDIEILVVEDDHYNRKVIEQMLNKIGLTNHKFAECGKDAIEMIKNKGKISTNMNGKFTEKSPYDIILMDIVMPEMSGVETAKKIFELFADIKLAPKIIAVTANVMQEDIDSYFSIGMKSYISKPISDKMIIYDTIRSVMLNN